MSKPSYFEHEPTVQDWLTIAEENLRGFERSPLHERLRTKKRDTYTQFFEIPDKTLLVLEKLLEKADKKPAPELRLSNIEAPWGCWELGMQNNPATIRLKTDFDTEQEYVYRFVCSVVNAVLLNTEDLVRHQCNNRACIRPDHLLVGSYEQNNLDDERRIYSGKGSSGKWQGLTAEINPALEITWKPQFLELNDQTDVRDIRDR